MARKEVLEKINKIGNCENADERLVLLTELTDEVTADYDEAETIKDDLSKTKEKLIKAQESNLSYFNRLTQQKTPEEMQKNQTGVEQPKEDPQKSYNDLIAEFEQGK